MTTHLQLAVAGDDDATRATAPRDYHHHLWLGSSPFFESTLSILPQVQEPGEQFAASLHFYDADGKLFNECGIACPAEKGMQLELKPFLESCKFDSGWKHAHLHIHSKQQARYICRVDDGLRTSFYEPPRESTPSEPHILPVKFTDSRKNLLAIVSGDNEEINLKLRLFIGNRKPDRQIVVDPYSARIVCLEDLFPDFIVAPEGEQLQAYLRMAPAGRDKGRNATFSLMHIQMNQQLGQKETFSLGGIL